jgi:hypothetical protein
MGTAVKTEGTAAPGRNNRAFEFLRDIPKQLLIAGKWVPAQAGGTFHTINPATEEVLATVAEGDARDVDAAVKAAREAFENGPWPRIRPHQRTEYLLKIAELVHKHADELAHVITLDNGKPISEARNEVARTAEVFRLCSTTPYVSRLVFAARLFRGMARSRWWHGKSPRPSHAATLSFSSPRNKPLCLHSPSAS